MENENSKTNSDEGTTADDAGVDLALENLKQASSECIETLNRIVDMVSRSQQPPRAGATTRNA